MGLTVSTLRTYLADNWVDANTNEVTPVLFDKKEAKKEDHQITIAIIHESLSNRPLSLDKNFYQEEGTIIYQITAVDSTLVRNAMKELVRLLLAHTYYHQIEASLVEEANYGQKKVWVGSVYSKYVRADEIANLL